MKESDRIAAIAEGLRRMGAKVEEFPDGLRVGGKSGMAISAVRRSIRRATTVSRWRWRSRGSEQMGRYDDPRRGMRRRVVP